MPREKVDFVIEFFTVFYIRFLTKVALIARGFHVRVYVLLSWIRDNK